MTVTLVEGFDHISTIQQKNWLHSFGGMGDDYSAPATGRHGGQSWNMTGQSGGIIGAMTIGSYFTKMWPATTTEAILGVAIYRIAGFGPGGNQAMSLSLVNAAGTAVASLKWDTLQRPFIYSPGFATSSPPANFIHQDGTWNYYEIRIKINGASGECELRMNGASVADIPTTAMNFGTAALGGIQFYVGASNGAPVGFYADDIYCVDCTTGSAPTNTFLGDSRVDTIYPTGAGASTEWDNNGGSNWDRVDDTVPDGDTTIVATNVAGEVDLYECSDVTIGSGDVWAVQTNFYAKKQDAGSREIAAVIRQGGANYVGSAKALSLGSYVQYSQLWLLDPLGAAWSVTKVNTDQFGIKLVT